MLDIMDAIAITRRAWMDSGLKTPAAIFLESHEEGMRFLTALRQQSYWSAQVGDAQLGSEIQMADGSVWMELKVMGISVRWPANRIAMPDGSWRHM